MNITIDKLSEPVLYYINSSGKNLRSVFLDILKIKYNIDNNIISKIKETTNIIHNASLVIDDIEDNTMLRRGHIAAHKKYGIGWSINASYLSIFQILNNMDSNVLKKIIENLNDLHIGQGYDIYCSSNKYIPTEEEYYDICEKKTGKMFEIMINMMHIMDTNNLLLNEDYDKLIYLCKLLSYYYQIRDDYVNLTDEDYWDQKGFCEDFDNNNVNYLIVYFNKYYPNKIENIKELISKKNISDKIEILKILYENKVMDIVYDKIIDLENKINEIIDLKQLFSKIKTKKFDMCLENNYIPDTNSGQIQ